MVHFIVGLRWKKVKIDNSPFIEMIIDSCELRQLQLFLCLYFLMKNIKYRGVFDVIGDISLHYKEQTQLFCKFDVSLYFLHKGQLVFRDIKPSET